MNEHWKIVDWNDECPDCGDGVKVFTDCVDGDKAMFGMW